MRAAIVIVAVILVVGAGGIAGYLLGTGIEETVTETTTETSTETVTEAAADGVPAPVEETRRALLEAAEAGDYEALRPLISESGFEYTFGGPVEGGAIAYWQELERTTDERPLEVLATILELPYVLSRGYYVWPWTYTVESEADLSAHERGLLARLDPTDRAFFEGTGYLGWRAGIAPDGSWAFYVAGD